MSLKATKIIARGKTPGLDAPKTATLKASNISVIIVARLQRAIDLIDLFLGGSPQAIMFVIFDDRARTADLNALSVDYAHKFAGYFLNTVTPIDSYLVSENR
jgi:hypothetical protein